MSEFLKRSEHNEADMAQDEPTEKKGGNIDHLREDTGKWIDGAPVEKFGITFFMRRAGTKEAQLALRQLKMKMFRPGYEPDEYETMVLHGWWLAEYLCAGWKDMYSTDGELEYSIENARTVFQNESFYFSINNELILESLKWQNYLYDHIREEIENLKK